MAIELVIASANPRLLDGLRSLHALGNFFIKAAASEADEAYHAVALHQPAVLVVEDDLVMPDEALIARCRYACSALKVVVVEGSRDFKHTFLTADAVVRRTSSMATLARTIESLIPEPKKGSDAVDQFGLGQLGLDLDPR